MAPETAPVAEFHAYRFAEGSSCGTAYMWLVVLMLVIAAVFWMYRSAIDHAKTDAVKLEGTWGLLTHNRRVQFGALRSEEHTSELQSLMRISYAVFCLTTINSIHY